jgi:hypothetical protein
VELASYFSAMGVSEVNLSEDTIDEVLEMVDTGAAFEIGRVVTLIDIYRQLHLNPLIPWIQKPENN